MSGTTTAATIQVQGITPDPRHGARKCQCPTCRTSRGIKALREALDEIDKGTSDLVEQAAEFEGDWRYLADEIVASLRTWAPWRARRRLREALRVVEIDRGVTG